jgi:hypothetical protein
MVSALFARGWAALKPLPLATVTAA